jgi:hypothetical protein
MYVLKWHQKRKVGLNVQHILGWLSGIYKALGCIPITETKMERGKERGREKEEKGEMEGDREREREREREKEEQRRERSFCVGV